MRLLIAMSVVALVAMAVPCAAIPIPGRLLTSGWNTTSSFCYFMDGDSDTIVTPSIPFVLGDVSPDSTKATYSVTTSGAYFYAQSGDVWVADVDGSNPVNLTAPAGIGGVNCTSTWSPDGSMIAFQHSDPATGEMPCDAGWQVWLMNSDGTNAHQLMPPGWHATWFPTWSPNGYRILCEDWVLACITVDLNGADVHTVPGVNGEDAKWSRDGSQLIDSSVDPDTVNGQPGVWRRLRLSNPDGTDPVVLVEQFIADADVEAHIAKYNFQPPDFDWLTNIRALVGPLNPRWSPTGDQIAFIAALPFDPNGAEYWYQREIWLYDLNSQSLTRLTNDQNSDNWITWNGHNTYPTSHQQVTVDSTTVKFLTVTVDGLTTIIRDDAAPALPAGDYPVEATYRVNTTATTAGPATVLVSYPEGIVSAGAEAHLAVVRYDQGTSAWQDITASRDTTNNVVTGETADLGYIALALPLPAGHFSDVPAGPSDAYWALWEIEAAYAAGIVQGYSDGTYQPTSPVTRDQMAVYVSRALAGGDALVPAGPSTATFSDVATDYWAFKYVEYAVDQGVVKGYSDGTYEPTGQVTRDQMSVFIARAIATPADGADLVNYTPPTTATFPDVPTDFWAYKYVEYIAQPGVGVTKGYPDGDYHPEYICTRDQMAVYVARAFRLQ